MIKALLLLDDFLYIAVIIGLILYALALRRRLKGIDDPRLWLPRKERQEWARNELKHREEEYDLAQLEKNLGIIQGKTTHKEESL